MHCLLKSGGVEGDALLADALLADVWRCVGCLQRLPMRACAAHASGSTRAAISPSLALSLPALSLPACRCS